VAAKKKTQGYRVSKRFSIWVEANIDAETFEAALEIAKKAAPSEMMEMRAYEFIDWHPLPGTGVSENWE